MAGSGVCRVCEDSKAARRGLIVGGSGQRFGVQHWKSPSRLFPNADNDVTGQPRVPGICVERAPTVRSNVSSTWTLEESKMKYYNKMSCVRANISHIIPKERTDDEHATCLPRPEKDEAMGELVICRPIMGAARARCAVQTCRTCALVSRRSTALPTPDSIMCLP